MAKVGGRGIKNRRYVMFLAIVLILAVGLDYGLINYAGYQDVSAIGLSIVFFAIAIVLGEWELHRRKIL